MITEILACVPLLLLARYILQKDPKPLLGIYHLPGKWYFLKKFWFYISVIFRKKDKRKVHENGVNHQFLNFDKPRFSDLDTAQSLLETSQGMDSLYFNGANEDGSCFVLRIIRKHGRRAEIWLTLSMPGIGTLQHPVHPDTLIYNTDGQSFSAGGMTFTDVEPLKKWRITFNGILKKMGGDNLNTGNKDSFIHVRFSFLWNVCGKVFDFHEDMNPLLLSEAVAKEPWNEKFWLKFQRKEYTEYEQAGEMHGVVHIDGFEERLLYLRGFRNHCFGVKNWSSYHRQIQHFCFLENGLALHIRDVSQPGILSHLKSGCVTHPTGDVVPLSGNDVNLAMLGENRNPPDKYGFSFSADGKEYKVQVYCNNTTVCYHGDDWESVVFNKMADFRVNGVKGFGVAEFLYRNDGGRFTPLQKSLPLLADDRHKDDDAGRSALVLGFTEPACSNPSLVGGKGCQLADLTCIQNKLGCIVPRGFCLTIKAFELQLKHVVSLSVYLDEVEHAAYDGETGALKEACHSTVQAIATSPLCQEIQQAIASHLIKIFGSQHDDLAFAVRSSASGEDGAEMSAAGQMDTILGVQGIHKVFEAVAKCWASQYAFQAVQYRRQHGQPVMSRMGVVIQEMVRSKASGVLFTRDPVTGNPGVMSIDANYGLGESVVSGVADPDVIQLGRSWDDKITISKKTIGQKQLSITMQDGGGTKESEITQDESSKCCLSDEEIIQLAKIGIELEKHFGNARDIEWAVCDAKLYLLQARPITTLDQESDWELMHEFDSALCSNREWLTTCNIGEMMPQAITPLTHSTFLNAVEFSMQYFQYCAGVRNSVCSMFKIMGQSCGHAFINLHGIYTLSKILGNDKRMADLSLTGRILEDLKEDEIDQYVGVDPWYKKAKNAYKNFMTLRACHGKVKKWEDFFKTVSLGDHNSSHDIYREIDKNLHLYYQCWADTIQMSAASGAWSSILMAVITQGKADWQTEHFSDVALLLSDCPDVYSADVPTAIRNLAAVIQENGEGARFRNMSTEEAVEWVESGENAAVYKKYQDFMSRHGHRCIREAEIHEKCWRTEPSKVISVVQALLRNSDLASEMTHKEHITEEEAVKRVKSPLTFFGRQILRWTLPRARKAVACREWGKSVSIAVADIFKQAYWKLAEKMVQEGRLPEKDLLFFLTHREIGKLLDTRSAHLITKAGRRQRLLQKQMALTFPEMSIGHPKPIEKTSEDDFVITSLKLKGMPVSQGVAKGTARVVTSLSAAGSIQSGDILIVQYTDVGWSPYFTMIRGLVTEKGGLLSHGAVVAREYGIPCVVNAQTATTMFKSGDQVIVNGTLGTIEKID